MPKAAYNYPASMYYPHMEHASMYPKNPYYDYPPAAYGYGHAPYSMPHHYYGMPYGGYHPSMQHGYPTGPMNHLPHLVQFQTDHHYYPNSTVQNAR